MNKCILCGGELNSAGNCSNWKCNQDQEMIMNKGLCTPYLTELQKLRSERDELKKQVEGFKFWTSVYPDGMTKEQVLAELHDYHFMMQQVPKVYMHITGGKLSKTNYYAEPVIACANDECNELVEQETKEITKERDELKTAMWVIRDHAIAEEKERGTSMRINEIIRISYKGGS